jgi:2-dehydro-3-deoxyglucarate aldolase/4-hydroxy-2-oxoheptanedioate aldolase
MAARGYGLDHFVRLPATDYASVMRPLEAGAGGVMISMVNSAAEAEQAVRWAKFWPRGERGLNGGNRDGRYGLMPLAEYTSKMNAELFVGIQIETAGALAELAAIAAIPDVDLLFVGPSDLSQVLGVPGQFEHPKCLEAIENLAKTCAQANKTWGVFSRGPEYADRMRAWGCQLFVLAADIHVAHAGIRAAKERYASFFPKPDAADLIDLRKAKAHEASAPTVALNELKERPELSE